MYHIYHELSRNFYEGINTKLVDYYANLYAEITKVKDVLDKTPWYNFTKRRELKFTLDYYRHYVAGFNTALGLFRESKNEFMVLS
jgi:hypothetical protein